MAAWILSALLAVALATTPVAHAAEIVPAERAADAVGSTVTIEGDVATARVESDTLVLELAPVDEKSFRAVLVLALISSLPRQPERVYEGKRVRVTGLVQRFRGRPEIVLEGASNIEIVDLAGTPVATQTPVTTTAPAPAARPTTTVPTPAGPTPAGPTTAPRTEEPAPVAPAAAPAPTPAPPSSPPAVVAPAAVAPAAPPPSPVTPPAPTAATPPPPAAPEESAPAPRLLADKLRDDACKRARTTWDDAATRVRDASAALTHCLDARTYQCRQHAKSLAPAIADLEWAEQNVADNCD